MLRTLSDKITFERANELLYYKDGELYWRSPRKGCTKDSQAGYLYNTGYKGIKIDGKVYCYHHIVWLLNKGYLPACIDHINHKPLDNRIENLRGVTTLENSRNRTRNKNNTSGVTGVNYLKPYKCWQARIRVKGKHISLGCFKNFDDAVKARKEAEQRYGFHENHGGVLC